MEVVSLLALVFVTAGTVRKVCHSLQPASKPSTPPDLRCLTKSALYGRPILCSSHSSSIPMPKTENNAALRAEL